ncbi:MAG: HDOD domain-containing protein [Phycisphaerales bacterium]|nr:HDOD domain-containing protein [Phycisphaerales bacterium]
MAEQLASQAPETRLSALDAAVQRVSEISTLPQIALNVIEVAQNPDAGAAELRDVVEGDPALSARVIRVVNSAAYGLRTTVSNLHQAISYLGFTQVRNLAMTASVSDIFKNDHAIGPYSRRNLWRHLVAVGICARLVARRCRLPNFEDAFLAGLLHDVGIILIDQNFHDDFELVIGNLDDSRTLCDVERECLGFDHCTFGERVAEGWRFPEPVRAAIRHHHASGRYKGPSTILVQCVEVANVVCSLRGITSTGVRCVKPALETFQWLGFSKEDVIVLAKDLEKEMIESESLFEL